VHLNCGVKKISVCIIKQFLIVSVNLLVKALTHNFLISTWHSSFLLAQCPSFPETIVEQWLEFLYNAMNDSLRCKKDDECQFIRKTFCIIFYRFRYIKLSVITLRKISCQKLGEGLCLIYKWYFWLIGLHTPVFLTGQWSFKMCAICSVV